MVHPTWSRQFSDFECIEKWRYRTSGPMCRDGFSRYPIILLRCTTTHRCYRERVHEAGTQHKSGGTAGPTGVAMISCVIGNLKSRKGREKSTHWKWFNESYQKMAPTSFPGVAMVTGAAGTGVHSPIDESVEPHQMTVEQELAQQSQKRSL
jgi:hypothetical protein